MADVYFGNPNIARQGQKARALAAGRSVEGLPDPRTYGFVSGLLSGDPNVGVSALSPSAGPMKEAAYAGAQLSNALMMAPAVRGAGLLANEGMMALGRAGERLAERVVPEVMARGGLPAQLMTDLAQGSQSKIWIGQNAKNWDKAAAEKFLQLEKSGLSNEEAWRQTGTFRGLDNKLRQEISDKDIAFKREKMGVDRAGNPIYMDVSEGTLNRVVSHPEFFGNYPGAKRIPTTRRQASEFEGEAGEYGMVGGVHGRQVDVSSKTNEGAKSLFVHEMQHLAQQKEQFSPGGIPGKLSFDEYQRLLGEVEARAAQARQNMTMQERRGLFPMLSYDVPIEQIIK